MDKGSSSSKPIHVLMFPWLAHGHFSAFAGLSTRLADQGIEVSFLTTPLNIPRIKPMLANHEKIKLLEMPFPTVDGLPPGFECTSDTPPHLLGFFIRVVQLLEKPFESLLQRIPRPDCIIFDILQYWIPKVATKFGIPTVFFLVFSASYCSYELSPCRAKSQEKITAEELTQPPAGYPSSAISWHLSEAHLSIDLSYTQNDGMRNIDRIMGCIEGCRAIAIKSCNELEEKFIKFFERVTMKPVFPVGPLLLPTQGGLEQGDSDCLKWLEKQQDDSVVYVSFGSESFLTEQQIQEIALGLEAAQQPFILVLRFQKDLSFVLPEGFENRVEQRRFVINGWAPQREILCHPATGTFVTHCGWSSVLEGMSNGLPLIAVPIQYDQGLNARLVAEELKVGVEVERGKDALVNKYQICSAVRRIMVGEEGKEIMQRAREMGNLFRGSISSVSQRMYIDKFVEHLGSLVV
ncbi:hypothetical protein KI387_021456 [Taxus chinensis]|uniref:Glycosyltransferase N-terminal domain-containing protein n=1 Tax=Taxus chinensis TaxID=29808 RepID=A0AA38LFY1_TAXCH|nr:hypothetical protein KI387_021456 [Taxus chinensis]